MALVQRVKHYVHLKPTPTIVLCLGNVSKPNSTLMEILAHLLKYALLAVKKVKNSVLEEYWITVVHEVINVSRSHLALTVNLLVQSPLALIPLQKRVLVELTQRLNVPLILTALHQSLVKTVKHVYPTAQLPVLQVYNHVQDQRILMVARSHQILVLQVGSLVLCPMMHLLVYT